MKNLAIAALVLGIIGILSCWIGIGILFATLALIFGFISCFNRNARGMAIAGLVLGIIGIIISAGMIYLASHPEMVIEEVAKVIESEMKKVEEKTKRIEHTLEKIESQKETIDYASFQFIGIEETNQIETTQKAKDSLWGKKLYNAMFKAPSFSEEMLSPKKGKYALVIAMKIENPDNKYIFPQAMYIKDAEGKKYQPLIRGVEPEKQEDWMPQILIKDIGWFTIISPEAATENIIAPKESFRYILIFHLPKERNAEKFLFEYKVSETADLSIGTQWDGKSSVFIHQELGK